MKRNIVIFANCFGNALSLILKKYYSMDYNIEYCVNYDIINNSKDIPESFKTADIFIYQNYSDKPDSIYDLKHILSNILKPDCVTISFPTLHGCNLIFCYDTKTDPINFLTMTPETPYGKFFYGIDTISKKCEELSTINSNFDNIIDEIIYKCMSDDKFISEEQILYYKNRSLDFLQKKCLTSDVPEIYAFIENNYTKIRLWHNPYHPTGILISKLIILILNKLNLTYNPTNEDLFMLENLLNDWVMPILPCVEKYFNFSFDCNKCSSWYHKDITDRNSYIKKYLDTFYRPK